MKETDEKYKKGKMKNYKGITLIALVVTIVVLLILAGVSIAMLTGENGIIRQAIETKDENRGANVEEAKNMWQQEKESSKLMEGVNEGQTVEEFVKSLGPNNKKLLTQDEVDQIIGNKEKGIEAKWEVTIGTRTITFAKTLVEAYKDGEIKNGDYVNYNPVERTALSKPLVKEDTGCDEEQNFTVDMNMNWRVLGLSEDGKNLLLTSTKLITRDGDNLGLELAGAEGYINCSDVLNEVCSIYKNDFAEDARSINVDDINRLVGVVVDEEKNAMYKITDTARENPLIGYEGYCGQDIQLQKGHYAPENYVNDMYPENEKYQKLIRKKAGDKLTGTSYTYSIVGEMIENSGNLPDLMSGMYWLATTGIYERSGYGIEFNASVCMMVKGEGIVVVKGIQGDNPMFDSDGLWVIWQLGVRPVITLKSNTTINDISVITKTEENEEVVQPNIPSYGVLSGENGLVDVEQGTFTLKDAHTNEEIGTFQFDIGDTWNDFIGSSQKNINGVEFLLQLTRPADGEKYSNFNVNDYNAIKANSEDEKYQITTNKIQNGVTYYLYKNVM